MRPNEACFDSDKSINVTRGFSKIKVRNDAALTVVCNNNKPIYMASNQYEIGPTDFCQQLSKKNRVFFQIERPIKMNQSVWEELISLGNSFIKIVMLE